jgi:hypothetical protein
MPLGGGPDSLVRRKTPVSRAGPSRPVLTRRVWAWTAARQTRPRDADSARHRQPETSRFVNVDRLIFSRENLTPTERERRVSRNGRRGGRAPRASPDLGCAGGVANEKGNGARFNHDPREPGVLARWPTSPSRSPRPIHLLAEQGTGWLVFNLSRRPPGSDRRIQNHQGECSSWPRYAKVK